MPFTPFHMGPALLIWGLFPRRLDLMSILVGSVILDLEPFYYLVQGSPFLHRFFHTFLGATIVGIVLVILFNRFYSPMGSKIIPGIFLGLYFHILLDSILYRDMLPFYPYDFNPMLGLFHPAQVYYFSAMAFIPGIILLFVAGKKGIEIWGKISLFH